MSLDFGFGLLIGGCLALLFVGIGTSSNDNAHKHIDKKDEKEKIEVKE